MTLDEGLVGRLLRAQFPEYADLPIRRVVPGGWDNRTFRLGDDLLVRLPSADGYVEAVAKEQRWLPVIAPRLPFEVPQPVACGDPTPDFPRPWSVYRWIEGDPAGESLIGDLDEFARDVARFLTALAAVDATDGPVAGTHSFWRGAHPRMYDDDVQRSLEELSGVIDTRAARAVWDAALETEISRAGRVVPRRHLPRQPAAAGWTAGRRHRLRHIGRRRSRVRSRHRLGRLRRLRPRRVPRGTGVE